jgi:phage baseplate assembly protein gpV
MYQDPAFSPSLVMALLGPKVPGCTATDSGATEIQKTFVANQKIGAASTYSLSLAAGSWTVKGVCGTDTTATAVASVLSKLATVAFNVPGTSFNFTHANTGGTVTTYTTGLNLGPIIFTAN